MPQLLATTKNAVACTVHAPQQPVFAWFLQGLKNFLGQGGTPPPCLPLGAEFPVRDPLAFTFPPLCIFYQKDDGEYLEVVPLLPQ